MQVLAPLNMFLKAAFNGYQYGEGCEPKCIGDNYGSYQVLSSEVPRAVYVWFFIPEKPEGDGGYIHPLPLQIMVAGKGAREAGLSSRSRCQAATLLLITSLCSSTHIVTPAYHHRTLGTRRRRPHAVEHRALVVQRPVLRQHPVTHHSLEQ